MRGTLVAVGMLLRIAFILLACVLVLALVVVVFRWIFPATPTTVVVPNGSSSTGGTAVVTTVVVAQQASAVAPPPAPAPVVAQAAGAPAAVARYDVTLPKGGSMAIAAGCAISGDIEPNGDTHWHDVSRDGTTALITRFLAPATVAAPSGASGVCGLDQSGMDQETATIRNEKLQSEHFQQVAVRVYGG